MLRQSMEREGISARELARRIRRPHTVVTRLLEGQESSRAAVAIAEELGLPPPTEGMSSRAEHAAVEGPKQLRALDADVFADIAAEIQRRLSRAKRR